MTTLTPAAEFLWQIIYHIKPQSKRRVKPVLEEKLRTAFRSSGSPMILPLMLWSVIRRHELAVGLEIHELGPCPDNGRESSRHGPWHRCGRVSRRALTACR